MTSTPRARASIPARLAAILLLGGAIHLGAPSAEAQQPDLGRLEGNVRAGDGRRPPRDVALTLTRLEPEPPVTRVATPDSLGRYAIDSLAPGRYILELGSALLDSLQLAVGAREVRIAAGSTVRLDLALPSDAAVHAALEEAERAPPISAAAAAPLLTGTASVTGTVADAAGTPLPGVQLQVRDARGAATTDVRGRYLLSGLPAGTHVLVARRIGYALVEQVIELRAGERTMRDLRLERSVALDSVRVTALGKRYREFEFNRGANIFGNFLTRDQILRRRPADVADLLPRLGGFTVIGHGPSARVFTKKEMRARVPCETNIVVDGVQGRRINDVRPARIVGLEAYTAPGSFLSDYESKCGLIVIWTSDWRAPATPR